MTTPEGLKTIRIISWNIHGTIGRSRKADREKTLNEIVRLAPDVIILQEVDERTKFGRPADEFDYFRKGLTERLLGDEARPSDHAIDIRTGTRKDCVCGNLLWSRLPIKSSGVFDLPGPDIEIRKVIDVVLDTGDGELRVLGTHFALLPTTRLKQARTVRDKLSDGGEDTSRPTVVLGDLNEWSPRGWVHKTLSALLPNTYQTRSWPERFPLAPLDRLYASKEIEIVNAFSDAKAGEASDHRPIIADIRIFR